MNSGGTSGTSVMIANSQLAQLNNPGMQPGSATTVEHACARCQDQTGALHMFCDTNESESCLVKAPAKHASESMLVVGELLCRGVQANTERHTRKETREMCSCWGYKQQACAVMSMTELAATSQCTSRIFFLTLLCKTTGISIIAAQVIPLTYRKHRLFMLPLELAATFCI